MIFILIAFGLMIGGQQLKRIEFVKAIPLVPKEAIQEPGPPYFGASVYELIQQPLGEVYEFLLRLMQAGGNATEIFLIHSLDGNTFQPYKWNNNKFDLDKWNDTYWAYFAYFLTECKERGIAPFIRIHDRCSIKRPELNKFYVFMNNKQGFHDVYDAGLNKYYSKLNRRLLNELKDAGINKYFIIPMNECHGSGDEVYDFNAWYSNWWEAKAGTRVIISAIPIHFGDLERLGCRYEAHKVASGADAEEAVERFGWHIFFNGDGCHGNGIASWNGYAEPSVPQARELGKYIRTTFDMFGYCYKLRSVYKKKGKVEMERADFRALRALTKTEE